MTTCMIFSSELDALRQSVEQGSKSNKALLNRILDAERVAKELSSIMLKIQDAYIRFLVRV
jgi:hypothetical protein